ncbi:ferredoxin [Halorussus amylolyticus]|uniref:ferredoxin n=1 Tax=Halorussus amylolyticus TaxID=1126242 RepID=UPI0010510269|nr:ferredoxin [Halorussus amylolyticus]
MSLAETVSKIDHLSEEERECIEICNEATEVCEECAEECERHDAQHCQVYAEVLTECTESCRNMMSA